MVGASREAEAERNAMLTVMQAADARVHDDDLLSRIGMLGEDPEADIATAQAAFTAGDLAGAQSAADDAYRAWTSAWQEGRRRALLVLAVARGRAGAGRGGRGPGAGGAPRADGLRRRGLLTSHARHGGRRRQPSDRRGQRFAARRSSASARGLVTVLAAAAARRRSCAVPRRHRRPVALAADDLAVTHEGPLRRGARRTA